MYVPFIITSKTKSIIHQLFMNVKPQLYYLNYLSISSLTLSNCFDFINYENMQDWLLILELCQRTYNHVKRMRICFLYDLVTGLDTKNCFFFLIVTTYVFQQ